MGLQPRVRETLIATIANGASLSDGILFEGSVLVGIRMPATWDAANLTFQGSMNDEDYLNIHDSAGNEEEFTVAAASTHISIEASDTASWRWIKVRSGTSGTPVNQDTGADPRLIELIVRRIS